MDLPGNRIGPLWHLTLTQLEDYARCRGISAGPVTKKKKPTKADYIIAISKHHQGPGAVEQQFGGGGKDDDAMIGTDFGVAFPDDCMRRLGRVVGRVPIPNPDRLWNTVVGFPMSAAHPGISCWHSDGGESTTIVQFLGRGHMGEVVRRMADMGQRPRLSPWTNSALRLRGGNIDPKSVERWGCVLPSADSSFAFTKFPGGWNLSLETLASCLKATGARDGSLASDFVVATALASVVSRAISDNPGTLIGRDTQHYAWRHEYVDGTSWIAFALVPFQYLPPASGSKTANVSGGTAFPVDDVVRKAMEGVGALYLKKSMVCQM